MFVLTVENAAEYARARGVVDGPLRAEELPGGVSCVTVRLHPEYASPVVVKQALPKLRVKAEWLSDPARAEREVILLRIARTVLGSHVPEVLDYDSENFCLCMESAPLDARNWKTMLMAGEISRVHAAQCGEILAVLHGISSDAPMIPDQLFDKTFFRQLRVEAYFLHVAEKRNDVGPVLRNLCEVLMSARMCISHGDYTPKNFLVHEDHLILLDYEVAHIGHPAFDIGSILNHLYLKSVAFPQHRERLRDAAVSFFDSYMKKDNSVHEDVWLWRCLGGLMLARVEGKSPVEYLSDADKPVVVRNALRLLRDEVSSVEEAFASA